MCTIFNTLCRAGVSTFALFTSLVGPDTMYMYEGKDYSKSSDSDRKTFDKILAGKQRCIIIQHSLRIPENQQKYYDVWVSLLFFPEQLRLCESAIGERALRSSGGNEGKAGGDLAAGLTLPEGRKRRQLSVEELEARRKKVYILLFFGCLLYSIMSTTINVTDVKLPLMLHHTVFLKYSYAISRPIIACASYSLYENVAKTGNEISLKNENQRSM